MKSAPATTDLFGRFLFRYQEPGTYQLCWDQPGWVPGCYAESIVIESNTKYPGPVEVRPLLSAQGPGAVWGPAAGEIVATNPGEADWEVPDTVGLHTAYVVVTDGHGGWASRSLSVSVGGKEAVFSGKVVDSQGNPIAGAHVSVNGAPVDTPAAGNFVLRVPLAASYVLNINAHGYALFSSIYDHGNISGIFPLTRAQLTMVDPRGTIDVLDRRPELERNRVGGARLRIAPNSLVDENGIPASVPLENALATLDIANSEMPGDYGALTGGVEVNLVSYGALFAEFRDTAGKRFNLAPGATADLYLPVPQLMRASAPATLVLWSYDEKTGLWNDDEGTATYNASAGAYVGKVKHFSTINTDAQKQNAACLRVSVDSSVPLSQVKARIQYFAGGVPFSQTRTILLDSVDNAFFRLVPNTQVKVEALDATGATVISDAVILDNGITPAAGGFVDVGPQSNPLKPGPPYSNCHKVAVKLQVPAWGGFSSSPFLALAGVGSEAQTLGYYAAVDPGSVFDAASKTWSGGNRDTLGDWWKQAGFGPDGSGGSRAAYLNDNDLGFGRDMHIRQSGGDVFGYVTNYGNPDQNPANADLANTANQAVSKATVAMEYTTVPGQEANGRVVKFFVYSSGQPTGKLINSADLDGFGQKFVPNLCQNCHGGEFYGPLDPAHPKFLDVSLRHALAAVTGSSFREFDLATYKFPGASPTPAPAVLPDFYQLNQLVKASNPQPAIAALIDGWYASSNTVQDNTWNPQLWNGAPQQDLYHQVIAPSCRTCHVAFGSDENQGLNWASYAQAKAKRTSIQGAVCGSYKYMPHALVTYRNFWLSTNPHRPDALKNFSATGWAAFGNCQ